MLIWLVLIPLIAAALIGLCKAPARPTALLSASLTLALGIWPWLALTAVLPAGPALKGWTSSSRWLQPCPK